MRREVHVRFCERLEVRAPGLLSRGFVCDIKERIALPSVPRLQQSPPRGLKKVGKGLSRSAPDERVDEPEKDRGPVSAKRNGLDLHIDSAVLFFQPPIVAETPKIAVPLANRKLRTIRLLGMLQLSDSRRGCAADRMCSVDLGVVNLEFGIEGNAARGVLVKLQIDFEGVVRVFGELRAAQFGLIGAPVVVVILQQ